jgi:hypothetical protein
LVVKSILISNSEGAQFAPNITVSVKAASTFFNVEFKLIVKSASDALHSEGARTVPTISSIEPHGPTSKLIVICGWTKVSLIFREDCTIFCEGEWSPTITKMHGDFTYLFNVIGMKVFGNNKLIELINSLVVGHSKLTELTSLVDIIGCNGLVGLIGLGLDDFIGLGLVSLVGLINRISLVGPICFSGISGLSLDSLVSISGLIGHNCLDGVISLSLVSLVGLVGLSGINGLIGWISLISLISISGFSLLGGFGLVSLIGFSGLISPNGLVSLDSLVAAVIAAAEFLVAMATQAAAAKTHGVAIKLASANKITNAAIWYYCAAFLVLLSFIWRESGLWCEWRVFSSIAGLNSVFKNALQNAKNHFISAFCKWPNTASWGNVRISVNGYLYVFDLAFVILKGIYGFKFRKRFLEISSRDLTSFPLLSILII